MFIISLTYTCCLDQIEHFLEEHVAFLKEQYAQGRFLASGRKVPRTGGVILARGDSKSELKELLGQDPFWREGLAEYRIQEFAPTMVADGLEGLLS